MNKPNIFALVATTLAIIPCIVGFFYSTALLVFVAELLILAGFVVFYTACYVIGDIIFGDKE